MSEIQKTAGKKGSLHQAVRGSSPVTKLFVTYLYGFLFCVILTAGAFGLVGQYLSHHQAGGPFVLFVELLVLAVVQLLVQLLFFFHLGKESKPRLNTVSFLFMLMVVGIIGFGSIWIMYHLNYNMMPNDVDTFIKKDENIVPNHSSHRAY